MTYICICLLTALNLRGKDDEGHPHARVMGMGMGRDSGFEKPKKYSQRAVSLALEGATD